MKDDYSLDFYFPFHLNNKQLADPMSVVRDFFAAASIKERLKTLKKWKGYVTSTESYKDKQDNPATLVVIWKENIQFIEAAWWLINSSGVDNIIKDGTTMITPKASPNHLKQIFKECPMPWLRQQLTELLEFGLSNHESSEFISANEIQIVYQTMQRLYKAGWSLIHQGD